MAGFVLPGGRLVSSQNAVADGSDHLLARALLNAHSESIPVEDGALGEVARPA